MKKIIFGVILLGVSLGLILFFTGYGSKRGGGESDTVSAQFEDLDRASGEVVRSTTSAKSPTREIKISAKESLDLWEHFKSRFGGSLVAQFSLDHRVVSIRGEAGKGTLGRADFNPTIEAQLKERGQEILSALSPLIGERQDWPVEFQEARTGRVSGQVFFRETYDGLVVKPIGVIRVDLGSRGELLGFTSDYIPGAQAIQPAVLSEQEVEEQARVVLGRQNIAGLSSSGMRSGQKIVWVSGSSARYAYEFFVEGRNLVIDAQNGKTLLFRDRRNF
jgi:hypothetical protein